MRVYLGFVCFLLYMPARGPVAIRSHVLALRDRFVKRPRSRNIAARRFEDGVADEPRLVARASFLISILCPISTPSNKLPIPLA